MVFFFSILCGLLQIKFLKGKTYILILHLFYFITEAFVLSYVWNQIVVNGLTIP